mgnify:CR=1 FL=1
MANLLWLLGLFNDYKQNINFLSQTNYDKLKYLNIWSAWWTGGNISKIQDKISFKKQHHNIDVAGTLYAFYPKYAEPIGHTISKRKKKTLY